MPDRIDTYAALLADITSWRLAPGATLREEELAARLGVSRTPVREALARLRAAGLVDQIPGQVARVSAVGVDSAVAIYQARDALETYAVQLAARSEQRGSFQLLAEEYGAFTRGFSDPDRSPETLYAISDRFDEALGAAVPNAWLMQPLRSTSAALLRLRRLAAGDEHRLTDAAQQRADECAAIAAGDAERAAEVSHHRIRASSDHVVRSLLEMRAGPAVFPGPILSPASSNSEGVVGTHPMSK